MIPVSRPVDSGRGRVRNPEHTHAAAPRLSRTPMGGTPRVTVPLPVLGMAGGTFNGMDPSDPRTHVRPWNPQPGMIGRLNWDGAQTQGNTDMGGTWGNPASWSMPAGGRPNRRPR